MCLHSLTALKKQSEDLSSLVGAFVGHGGMGLFVISRTVVGKHKIKRLSEPLPCLFSNLVS